MQQDDGEEKVEAEEEATENWRNEHGMPDFKYLQSMATDGSADALEKLQSIAKDMDVEYDPDDSAADLIEKIRLAAKLNEDGNVTVTT